MGPILGLVYLGKWPKREAAGDAEGRGARSEVSLLLSSLLLSVWLFCVVLVSGESSFPSREAVELFVLIFFRFVIQPLLCFCLSKLSDGNFLEVGP